MGAPNGLGAFKPLSPSAAVTVPASIAASVSASFGAAQSSDPYPGGSITRFRWEWGDGSPPSESGSASATHTFPAPGSYQLTLTVTDNYGLSSAKLTKTVVVGSRSPAEQAAAEEATREEEAAKRSEEEAAKRREAEVAKRREEEAPAAGDRSPEPPATARHEEEQAPLTANLHEVAAFHATVLAAVPDAELASTTLLLDATGPVALKISCPPRESSCAGTVRLRTLGAVAAGAAGTPSRGAAILTLARGSFTVTGGRSKRIVLALSAQARALLSRSHMLRVRVTIAAHDPAGASHTSQRPATLRLARSKHSRG